MFVIKYKKIWYILSAILLALSVWAMFAYSFNLSIDFKGGTITEISYPAIKIDDIVELQSSRPAKEKIEGALNYLNIGGYSIRPSGSDRYVIRTKELSDVERNRLNDTLLGISSTRYAIERQNTIGPVAGAELQSKALKAILVVVMMIVLFITFAFRKV